MGTPTSEPTDLQRLLTRMQALEDELAEVKATAHPPLAARPAESVAQAPERHQSVGRRAALRRAGMLAAGAVVGGAALVATTADPAAAATVSGSGNPGVNATGVGGDGIRASTNNASSSGIYAFTPVASAYCAFMNHGGGGVALHAQSGVTLTNRNVAEIINTSSSGGTALSVSANGGEGVRIRTSGGNALRVESSHPDPTVTLLNTGSYGTTLAVYGAGTAGKTGAIGMYVNGVDVGIAVHAQRVGGQILGRETTLCLLPGAKVPITAPEAHQVGDIANDGQDLWYCTADGTPGTWRKLSGTATAGALHVLPAPARVYDSRPGTAPGVGPKTPLVPNTARTVDLKANSSGVPAGATAALVTVLLVNATSGNGNLTVWANGVAKPSANTLVWGGTAGRFTAKELTALDAAARIQVSASLKTDIVVDVVGYYR